MSSVSNELIDALRDPRAYPHEIAEIELVQTHASMVFLVGDEVYKIKKPVDFGFLDYSTLEKRKRMCEEEVRLNRRLAPDVYLGVVPIASSGAGKPVIGGSGTVIEHAVHMRRLPEVATLRSRIAAGATTASEIAAVARRIAAFHAAAARGPEVSAQARFEVVAANCRDNFAAMDAMVGGAITETLARRLRDRTEAELDGMRATIEARAACEVACETHGDLRLDHVYVFPESPPPADVVAIDCVEFDPRYRHADPFADVAFLFMDLWAVGRPDLAHDLVDAYVAASRDEEGRSLLPLYAGYRATVRGKVAGLEATQAEVEPGQRERALARARAAFVLALVLISPPRERPALVLVIGPPGAGKSVLASALAREGGFRWIRSDEVRKQLAAAESIDPGPADLDSGIYSAAWTDRTYAACLQRAEAALLDGDRVVVDANFKEESRRAEFVALARELRVPVRILACTAPPEVLRARVRTREGDVSDATEAVLEHALERFEPPGPTSGAVTSEVDSSASPETTFEAARAVLEAEGLW